MNNRYSGRRFSVSKNNLKDKNSQRLAILLGLTTVLIIVGILLGGIPLLMGLANLLGNINNSDQEITQEDTVPPVPPTFFAVTEATNSAILKLSGSSEPESKVEIYLNNNLLLATQADEQGLFSVEKVTLEKGTNTLTAKALDASENQSQNSEEAKIVFDDQPPQLEITAPEDKSTVYSQTVEVKGISESENIKITVNDRLVVIEKEGEFTYPYELSQGENKITVVAEDLAGNQTEKELTVNYQP
ncbi:MAG: Ig-like domain-containing protein [Candidatus Shapirobacteria bacterium]